MLEQIMFLAALCLTATYLLVCMACAVRLGNSKKESGAQSTDVGVEEKHINELTKAAVWRVNQQESIECLIRSSKDLHRRVEALEQKQEA